MTTQEQNVKNICNEVYKNKFQQITIDLIQDEIEEIINSEDGVSRDMPGAAAYQCSILLECFNPIFERDIDLLTRLEKALEEWSKEIEKVNVILGIPIES